MEKPRQASAMKTTALDAVVAMVRSGQALTNILEVWRDWLWKRSRILFYSDRDLFVGRNEEDVFDEVQIRFTRKLEEIGYDGCETDEQIVARTHSFTFNSLRETKTMSVRKIRETHIEDWDLVEGDGIEQRDEEAGEASFEKRMRQVFLRTCIENLPSEKQRDLGRRMLANETKGGVAKAWDASKQSVEGMFKRMLENLRSCIETKRQAIQWTPTSSNS